MCPRWLSLIPPSTAPCPRRLICTPSPTSTTPSTGVRRYGFHGTSHKYVSHKAAEYLEEPHQPPEADHLPPGNGSSITAVDQGRVVDTSMGMTPLAGLMMGTRCGDLDPSVSTT